QALSPLDLEETFGLTGGDIFHGALSLDQLFWARPMIGYADYRGPLRGLYHCGSGAHPGGGVTGLPRPHPARGVLRDPRRRGRAGEEGGGGDQPGRARGGMDVKGRTRAAKSDKLTGTKAGREGVKVRARIALIWLLALPLAPAAAQEDDKSYPSRAIHIVVPF